MSQESVDLTRFSFYNLLLGALPATISTCWSLKDIGVAAGVVLDVIGRWPQQLLLYHTNAGRFSGSLRKVVRCTSRLPMTPSAAPSTLGNRKEQRIQHGIRGESVKRILIG